MRRLPTFAVMAVAAALVGCGGPEDTDPGDVGTVVGEARTAPATGKRIGTILNNSTLHNRSRITYHNGPVMPGTSNVYLIWYGNWTGNTAMSIITDLVLNLGFSNYFLINAQYKDAAGAGPNSGLIYSGAIADSYSRGAALSDPDIAAVVMSHIASGALPLDPAGIYVVLGAADVTATSGFCTQYCGQHNATTFNGSQVKYIFVGNTDRCPSACSPQAVGPNDNAGADGMANALVNELSSTVTDPTLTAWFDREGFENADKCAWSFGTTYAAPNGAQANLHLGTRDFLLQRNWFPTQKGGVCAMSVTGALQDIANGLDDLG